MLHGAGIFTYIWVICRANVGKYSIHGAYGKEQLKISQNLKVCYRMGLELAKLVYNYTNNGVWYF